MADTCRHEEVPRHFIDGMQHRKITDALILQLLDEPPPRTAEILPGYCSCHQLSGVSSIA